MSWEIITSIELTDETLKVINRWQAEVKNKQGTIIISIPLAWHTTESIFPELKEIARRQRCL